MTTVLEAIPVFLAVLDTGSIKGAARHLDLSRPTVRRRLHALQSAVGVPLLARTSTGLQPTVAGEVYANRAREILAEVDALRNATRAVGASPHGVLRVGVPVGTPPEMMAAMGEAVAGMWPDVRLELISSNASNDLIDRVDCRFSLELDEPDGEVEVMDLGVVREQLVASRAYLAATGPIETVAQLSSHKMFAWSAPDTGTPTRLPVKAGPEPRVEFAMVTNDLRALVWLASHEHGLAFMPFEPAMAASPDFGGDELVPVLPQLISRDRPRRLVTSKAVAATPVVEAFLKQTRAVADSLFGEPGSS